MLVNCGWGEWSGCEGQNVVCAPNEVQSENCGTCGQTRERTCNNICQWGSWGECQSLNSQCAPGETQDQSCGVCQTQTRTCTDECTWSGWGACQQGSCTSGQTETRACGLCGSQTRQCTDQCAWGDWEPCTGGGVCSPGESITVECGTDVGVCQFGTKDKTCTDSCTWEEGSCQGGVQIASEACGSERDLNCDGTTEDNPDSFEVNNTCGSCSSIAMLDPMNFTINATIDNFADVDYYCFQVEDNISLNPLNLNEELTVTLEVPGNRDYDLYLYKSVTDCTNDNELALSNAGRGDDEDLVWTEPLGQDDSGVYVIAVKGYLANRDFSCEDFYTLTINGLH